MFVRTLQNLLRSLGFQIVRSPIPDHARNRDVLWRLFDRFSINCVLDVGANTGQYGEWLRAFGYKGWIISFEPVRSTFEELARAASKDERWRVFQYALGATRGEFEINYMADSQYNSFLDPTADAFTRCRGNSVKCKEMVQVLRLDEVLDECIEGIQNPRMYLKLDTQGFDVEVLKGAEKVLPQILSLQSELSFRPIYRGMRSYAEAIAEFNARGLYVVDFVPVSRDLDGLCVVEMDGFMARRPDWPSPATAT